MGLIIKKFNELTVDQLYRILQLRNAVFIVEQNCPYLDIDGKDQDAIHMFYPDENNISAYLRILPGPPVAIGRVLVEPSYRRQGLARKIMEEAIEYVQNYFSQQAPIKLQAQSYLVDFYQSLGFEVISEEYLEDDIPHRDMLLKQ